MKLNLFKNTAIALAAALVFTVAPSLRAQSNDVILRLSGSVAQPQTLTLAQFKKLPHRQIMVGTQDDETSHYDGVQLADLIKLAQPILTEKCCSNTVNTMVVITAADQYQAIFSLPELDEKFQAQQIVLADKYNDKALDSAHGPLQLVVPGEKAHGRWVRQVTSIQIVSIGKLASRTNSSPP